MSSRMRVGLRLVVAALAVSWIVAAAQGAAKGKVDPKTVVATVGPTSILRQDFEQQLAAAERNYLARRGSPVPDDFRPLFERQILEAMIRSELTILEADHRKLQVSDADAEAELHSDPFFQTNGVFDPQKLDQARARYPMAYQEALRKARRLAAGRRLNRQILEQATPDEAKLRAEAERLLTRASLEYLAIHRSNISGKYPEPRESAILEYYRRHTREFEVPPRAELSVILFSEPGPASDDPGIVDEWRQAMKARADSALDALSVGRSFDEVGEANGGVHGDIEVIPGNFPGYWKGTPSINSAIFKAADGSVFPEPIPANPGWLVARVERARPAHRASLAEAAPEIRNRLREDSRRHHLERELRAVYERNRDQLHGPAYRLRYAQASLDAIDPGTPTEEDLDQFYRAHLADYTSYDAATASIVSKSLEQVHGEVQRRWHEERKALLLRSWTEKLEDAWRSGRRDRSLEGEAQTVRELGPVPEGAVVDSGAVGRALTQELAQRGYAVGVGSVILPASSVVYQVTEKIPDYQPTFEQIFPMMVNEHLANQARLDEQAAHEMFDRNPERFASGKVLYFTRLIMERPDPITVPLTREEVERYHQEHIDRYSSPEEVRVRHILITPRDASPEADEAARRRAEELLRRARAGEDFALLAHEYSDDPPTREHGGDLGYLQRGRLLKPVEDVAFSLGPGEVSDVVKSSVGYHILKEVDHVPMAAAPLEHIYTRVAGEGATEKAEQIVKTTIDSLYQVLSTPQEALEAARKLHLSLLQYRHVIGDRSYPSSQQPTFALLEKIPIGKLYPGPLTVRGVGTFLQWPDSVVQSRVPTWETARGRVLEAYQQDLGERAFEAKRAELDSLLRSGWTIDSVAALWGGFARANRARPGGGLPGLQGGDLVDSLVFGRSRPPALAEGETSGWVEFPSALVRVRLVELRKPKPATLRSRVESERRLLTERRLIELFADLKRRFPVRILDQRLHDVILPKLPETTLL